MKPVEEISTATASETPASPPSSSSNSFSRRPTPETLIGIAVAVLTMGITANMSSIAGAFSTASNARAHR